MSLQAIIVQWSSDWPFVPCAADHSLPALLTRGLRRARSDEGPRGGWGRTKGMLSLLSAPSVHVWLLRKEPGAQVNNNRRSVSGLWTTAILTDSDIDQPFVQMHLWARCPNISAQQILLLLLEILTKSSHVYTLLLYQLTSQSCEYWSSWRRSVKPEETNTPHSNLGTLSALTYTTTVRIMYTELQP